MQADRQDQERAWAGDKIPGWLCPGHGSAEHSSQRQREEKGEVWKKERKREGRGTWGWRYHASAGAGLGEWAVWESDFPPSPSVTQQDRDRKQRKKDPKGRKSPLTFYVRACWCVYVSDIVERRVKYTMFFSKKEVYLCVRRDGRGRSRKGRGKLFTKRGGIWTNDVSLCLGMLTKMFMNVESHDLQAEKKNLVYTFILFRLSLLTVCVSYCEHHASLQSE